VATKLNDEKPLTPALLTNTDRRTLLDGTVHRIVREAPQAIRFGEIDARTRGSLGGIFEQPWSSRHTHGALQRLRKAGYIKTRGHLWGPVPMPALSKRTK